MNSFISRVTIFLGIQPKYNMLSAKYFLYTGWIPRKMLIYEIPNTLSEIEEYIVSIQKLQFFWEFILNKICTA